LQITLEPIPHLGNMPSNPNNYILLIVMESGRGLFKTYAFIGMWSWTLRPCFRIDGCLGLPGPMVIMWCARKCCIKLYLVIYYASHPSTLQTNLGPSFAQWTPFMATKGVAITFMATPSMAIRRGAITSKTQKKNNKLNVTRSQVTGWNPFEGSTKSSCGKLRLRGTLLASNSRKG
jgi:hypothetical protein